MTQRWGLFAMVALGTSLVVGCPAEKEAPSPASSVSLSARAPAPPVPQATRAQSGVTLRYYGDGVGQGPELERILAERFTADTGVRLEIKPMPRSIVSFGAYESVFQAHQAVPDVVILDVIWPGAFAASLLDLKGPLGDATTDMIPEIVRNNTIGGKLVAMPLFTDAGMLFYRTDLLAKYGYAAPPETWDALEAVAARMQAGERATDRDFWGYVFQGASYEGLTCNALEWQVSHGGGTLFSEETGQVDVDNPRAIAAFRRAAGWIDRISPGAVLRYQEEDARQVFQAGHAAFMRNWPYAYAAANAPDSVIRGQFSAGPLPRNGPDTHPAAVLGGWQLGVSAYSKHPEAAIAFVRYMTCPEVQTWRAKEGTYLPTTRKSYEDPTLLAAQPMFKVIPQVLEGLVARPSSRTAAHYGEVSSLYYKRIGSILRGADPVGAVGTLAIELQKKQR